MKIKSFLITIYAIAGLCISIMTAIMTYLIIGQEIGSKMFFQIVLVIVFVLPIIILISYFLGNYLGKNFNEIQEKLKNIKQGEYKKQEESNKIKEIQEIHVSMNFLSNKLEVLIDDLKQKNQNLSNLLISMAHDIKTPITILNGYIEEIEDGLIKKEELPSILKSMKNEVNFLNELTIDMLQFINSMQNNKPKEKINLYKFLEDELLTLVPKKENIDFQNNIDKSFDLIFNKIDLKKICINLLCNSYKYTKSGYIKLYIEDNIIHFENSGESIEDKYKDKIFEPFFTLSKSRNRKESGFGLGLSIVDNLSRNNGYSCFLKQNNKTSNIFILVKKKTN
jgi:two-component system sensor histidine kinase SaeS